MELANIERWDSFTEFVDDLKSDVYYQKIDTDGNGYIDLSELKSALDIVGFRLPQWQVRKMVEDFDRSAEGTEGRGKLSFGEFQDMCAGLKAQDIASSFKKMVNKRENLETLGGMSTASSEGTTHSVRLEEQLAFSDWINSNLEGDPHLAHVLPIDGEGRCLYDRVKDGILLWRQTPPPPRTKPPLTPPPPPGKPHLVLGLLWQIIRIGLFNQISLEHCPGLAHLLEEGERIEELMKLSPEAILLRWVNHHLERAGVNRRCTNFMGDIKDSEIYSHLLKQIAPNDAGVTLEALSNQDLISRAEVMLQQAEKLGCRSFVTPQDVVEGVYKLNVAFVANLFNNHPGLDQPENLDLEGIDHIEETREEKTYRNWMNSMGVNPHVNWLYSDLADGIIIFQLYDIIRPGIVDWKRVHTKFSKLKRFMEKLENCNYAVELGRTLKFSLVGIAGQDLAEGNPTLTLALIWQLMRAYTLSILTQLADSGSPIVEAEIITYVNSKLQKAGKSSSVRSFQDSSLRDAMAVIDLVDAISPGTIDYSVLKSGGGEENNLANAKYAISMSRKIGARIYALPEDIAQVKPKMVMTVFACLMARDYIPSMDAKRRE
ncbi:plastin-2-like [Penaeus japonicus]|uniref:plastin-2-like n=1 Tax=Penaeus japonicus TaxID=27405 RepID=UPI001C70D39D|nr:plastin-2-like [Penaeus japonicus]